MAGIFKNDKGTVANRRGMVNWKWLICITLLLAFSCEELPIEDNPSSGNEFLTDVLSINEIMQSNIDCIMDDLNEFPDSWVELYNSSDDIVKLDNYSVGLSENVGESYQLPSYLVAPHSFVLIYCDKEGKGLHTSFRIDSGKGELYLFKEGKVCDYVNLKKQSAPNISFGRKMELGDEWGYQLEPSPGKQNCRVIAKDVLPKPIINATNAILLGGGTSLSIDMPSNMPENTIIRYTLDGSEPTLDSDIYNGPISITHSTAVRAKLFCDNYLSDRSVTQSIILTPRKHNLPIVSMVTDDKFINSDSIGIYSNNVYSADSVNWKYNWRRPVNVEYFDIEGNEIFNQLCETRIHGGGSRQYVLKSMVCYANKRFGTKRFNCEFFPKQRPGTKEWKSFILRNSGSDFVYLYMRDAIIQGLIQKHMNLDCQAYQPVVFYLNGAYKGLMYLMERSTEEYVESNYGIEDFDMIETWVELKRGDWTNFNAFEQFYSEDGHTFEDYSEWMDIEEFCDYMIMEFFFANRDWPHNNVVMWRPRSAGGKWRWIVKDMDFGLGLGTNYDFNMFPWFYGDEAAINEPFRRMPPEKCTLLFKNLMKTPEFRTMFIERSEKYVNEFLNSDAVHEVWDSLWEEVGEELLIHRAMYEQYKYWTWRPYDEIRNEVSEWIRNRPTYYVRHVNDFFGTNFQN